MPQFVLLFHDWPAGPRGSHCDLMLESGGVLRTWSLAELPRDWALIRAGASGEANRVDAEQLGDHRLAFLDYEGPVSADRGSVRRLDRGECLILEATAEFVRAELHGRLLRSTITLQRSGERWQLTLD